MPNLVGVWSPSLAKDMVERVVARQLDRVRVPRNTYAEYRATFPGFGMALQDHGLLENGIQPAWTENGNIALLLDGEVTNAAELMQRFAPELPHRRLSSPELCLHLIVIHGPAIARTFNGFFCIVVYDEAARRLTLIADRYGARPLYYARRQGSVFYGSELKALSVADTYPRKVDDLGLLELFCYGTHFMDRTWMEGYRRLGPATILTVDPEQFALQRYWIYRYVEGRTKLDQQTYASVFGILLDRAVERCMQGTKRKGIFLSGGYDSRSAAAAIRPHWRPLPAFTFGAPESRDVRFAAMLAERLGLVHHILTRRGPYLYRNCRAIVWRTEGMMTFANATSIQWHQLLGNEMDIILTGFLGEFSGSHTWPALLMSRSRADAVKAIFHRFVEPRLGLAERIFQPAFYERTLGALREAFQRSFDAVEDEHPLDMADSWNFVHLQPRGTFHAPAVDRHRFEMRAPHTDNDLVDFLLGIPPFARLEQRVYKKMIAQSFPLIRDVPCTNSGRPVNPHFVREYVWMTSALLARRAAARVQKRFSRSASLGREFRDLGEDFRAEPELTGHLLPSLLKSGMLPDSIFNHRGIDQIVQAHIQGKGNYEHAIGLLISVGLAVKYFLHDDVSDVPSEIYASEDRESSLLRA